MLLGELVCWEEIQPGWIKLGVRSKAVFGSLYFTLPAGQENPLRIGKRFSLVCKKRHGLNQVFKVKEIN